MTDRLRGALILTHNRQELLDQCIAAIAPQVDVVLVIDNASSPPAVVPNFVHLLKVPDQPPNLSNLWNRGFQYFERYRKWNYPDEGRPDPGLDIAMLCDDAIVPEGWFAAVTEGMRLTDAATGCSNPWGTQHPPFVKTAPDGDITNRMIGWAWVVDHDREPLADETMRWWYLDTDMDWWARAHGGFVMVGGYSVPNVHPGGWTNAKPELGGQVAHDRAAFAAKHGSVPW
jgi:hypothetical protein